MNMNKQPNRAFTLIEMMLVIALIAVLATIGINAYQKTAEQSKIDKSALQMQTLLQAGMAYYVDYGCWPDSTRSNPDCKVQPPPDFQPYIPIGARVNGKPASPWGTTYDWLPVNGDKLFEVYTYAVSKPIADRLAAKLPNASASGAAPWRVVAMVGIPGSSLQTGIVIKKLGYVSILNNGKAANNIAIPACSAGSDPHIYLALNYFSGESIGDNWSVSNARSPSLISMSAPVSGNHWAVSLTLKSVYNDGGVFDPGKKKEANMTGSYKGRTIQTQSLYIVTCEPKDVILRNESLDGSYRY